jgi:hypothetical protein
VVGEMAIEAINPNPIQRAPTMLFSVIYSADVPEGIDIWVV